MDFRATIGKGSRKKTGDSRRSLSADRRNERNALSRQDLRVVRETLANVRDDRPVASRGRRPPALECGAAAGAPDDDEGAASAPESPTVNGDKRVARAFYRLHANKKPKEKTEWKRRGREFKETRRCDEDHHQANDRDWSVYEWWTEYDDDYRFDEVGYGLSHIGAPFSGPEGLSEGGQAINRVARGLGDPTKASGFCDLPDKPFLAIGAFAEGGVADFGEDVALPPPVLCQVLMLLRKRQPALGHLTSESVIAAMQKHKHDAMSAIVSHSCALALWRSAMSSAQVALAGHASGHTVWNAQQRRYVSQPRPPGAAQIGPLLIRAECFGRSADDIFKACIAIYRIKPRRFAGFDAPEFPCVFAHDASHFELEALARFGRIDKTTDVRCWRFRKHPTGPRGEDMGNTRVEVTALIDSVAMAEACASRELLKAIDWTLFRHLKRLSASGEGPLEMLANDLGYRVPLQQTQ